MADTFNKLNSNLFANIARRATTISPIIEGKTKIPVAEIISTYPDGITITAFDMVQGTDQQGNATSYPVFVFAEDETRFGFGGTVLKNIVHAWIEAFEGDIESCSKALAANGGVKLRFAQGHTKAGRSVTTIDVVG